MAILWGEDLNGTMVDGVQWLRFSSSSMSVQDVSIIQCRYYILFLFFLWEAILMFNVWARCRTVCSLTKLTKLTAWIRLGTLIFGTLAKSIHFVFLWVWKNFQKVMEADCNLDKPDGTQDGIISIQVGITMLNLKISHFTVFNLIQSE